MLTKFNKDIYVINNLNDYNFICEKVAKLSLLDHTFS